MVFVGTLPVVCRGSRVCHAIILRHPPLQITGLILMTTAIIFGVEQAFQENAAADDDGPGGAFADAPNDNRMQWHDALYFTIVTLSTVG